MDIAGKEGKVEVSPNLEHLLKGRPDMSTIIFGSFLDILLDRIRINGNGVMTIREVKRRRATPSIANPEEVRKAILDYIREGLPHFHSAQQYFDAYIAKDAKQGEYTHVFNGYGSERAYHTAVITHLKDIKKSPKKRDKEVWKRYVDQETKKVLETLIATEAQLNSWKLEEEINLALRHGEMMLGNPQYMKIVLTKARIKSMENMVEKFARKLGEGILLYNEMLRVLTGKRRENVPNRAMKETFAGMFAHGFSTPLVFPTEREGIFEDPRITMNPLDFLYFYARIKDMFALTYIAQTMEQARELSGRLEKGKFKNSDVHQMVHGYNCIAKSRNHQATGNFVPSYLKEDNFIREGKTNPKGNLRVEMYMEPKLELPQRYRFEVAVTALKYFCSDEAGGEGSHYIYRERKRDEVKNWPDPLFALNEDTRQAFREVITPRGEKRLQEQIAMLALHNNRVYTQMTG